MLQFINNIFCGRQKQASRHTTEDILAAYGETLEHSHGIICDVSELPYPKEAIVACLLDTISSVSSPILKEKLVSTLLLLGNFLPLTPEEREAVREYEEFVKPDNDPLDPNQVHSQAQRYAKSLEIYTNLMHRSQVESERLRSMLAAE